MLNGVNTIKRYLLTWYGITDLRAAMDLEKSDGPVLGALREGNYTDVFILAYTNKEKQSPKYSDVQTDLSDEWGAVDSFSNTAEGHALYEIWLTKQLANIGKEVNVKLYPVKLLHLNDTKGIYKAVTNVLNDVSSREDYKEVTLYLSPGTPVMAFTWAFASLMNPSLKIKVIASSDFREPPEAINLPYELLDSSGIKHKTVKSPNPSFDAVFHLFGEQRMPSVLGINQFKSKMHIFINSKKYPATIMKKFIGSAQYKELPVNPFDPKNIELEILKTISELPAVNHIGFNLTGGTKLMFVGALSASDKVNGTPFYFETKSNNLIYLNDFSFTQTKSIESVETIIKANTNEFTISNNGAWNNLPERNHPQRKSLTKCIWKKRNKISKLYKELSYFNDSPGRKFEIKKGDISVKLSSNGNAEILIGNEKFSFSNWINFAKYLCGGWFEEYIYQVLSYYLKSGQIKDLRIGLEISIKDKIDNTQDQMGLDWKDKLRTIYGELYQELDIVFTDGKSLYIIECKAGNVRSVDLMKLQNIVSHFGGIEGKGIIISPFKPNSKVIHRKIAESRNVDLLYGAEFSNKLKDKLSK